MPSTTLHLSSANSTLLGSGQHELKLQPGLSVPMGKTPTCYLHDLTFTNTIVNVSEHLYKNGKIKLKHHQDPMVEFTIPDGVYSLGANIGDPNKVDNRLIGVINDHFQNNADPPFQPITSITPDPTRNRVTINWIKGLTLSTDEGSNSFLEKFLGFSSGDIQSMSTGSVQTHDASNVARIDRARGLAFHCPSIVSGVYSSSGKLGGSQMGLVPITADPGFVQAWAVRVPVRLDAKLAGAKLDKVVFYLATEDGDRVDLQGERFDAVVVIEW